MSCFASEKQLNYLLALCNTKVVMKVLEVIADVDEKGVLDIRDLVHLKKALA